MPRETVIRGGWVVPKNNGLFPLSVAALGMDDNAPKQIWPLVTNQNRSPDNFRGLLAIFAPPLLASLLVARQSNNTKDVYCLYVSGVPFYF